MIVYYNMGRSSTTLTQEVHATVQMQQTYPSCSRARSRSPVGAVGYHIGPQTARPSSPVPSCSRRSMSPVGAVRYSIRPQAVRLLSPVRPPPRATVGNDAQSSSGEELGDVREQWRHQGNSKNKKKDRKKKKNTKELIRENELMKNKLLKHLLRKEEISDTSDAE